jgi:1-pyrroline-5-carboxylate dehydrogenase
MFHPFTDLLLQLADFFRFGVKYVEELYSQQPPENAQYCWNRLEYRPLEGFVLAVSPFNFTAIGGNLAGAPALVGNVVVWKPSSSATYSNYIIHRILLEAGLPPSVIQFVPGAPAHVVTTALGHREFAGLHFTGSTKVFRDLWKEIGNNVGKGAYKSYPRVVGETGGKNWHLVHQSADVRNAVLQTVRSAFEYQGLSMSSLLPSRMLGAQKLDRSEVLSTFKTLCCFVSVAPVQADAFGGDCENQSWALGEVGQLHGSSNVSPCSWLLFQSSRLIVYSGKPAFEKISGYIAKAKQEGGEILCGGSADDSTGYFVQPTIVQTKDPRSITMREEIFGPVLTVSEPHINQRLG